MSDGFLEGEVAFITGGASGLGLSIARRFRAEGAHVCVLDRSAQHVAAVKGEFGDDGLAVEGDVRNYADNAEAVARAVARFGKLTVFVGNAGIYDKRVSLKDVNGQVVGEAFDEMFGINVKGYVLGAKAASEELTRNNGAIVFTASVSRPRNPHTLADVGRCLGAGVQRL